MMIIPSQWFLPAHTTLEILSIFFAWIVFLLGWSAYTPDRPRNIIFLSCFFLSVGLLDFLHMMSFEGMPPFVTSNNTHKAIVFWLAARLVATFTLLAVVCLPWMRFQKNFSRYLSLIASVCMCMLLTWIGLFRADWIPETFIVGYGLTPFKIGMEVAILVILLVIMGILLSGFRKIEGIHKRSLIIAISFMILSGPCFIFYNHVTDLMNFVGHLLKVIAYYYIYQAILKDSIHVPYAKLLQSEKDLIQIREKFAATIHSMQEAVIISDVSGRIELINPNAQRITQWSEEDALGTSSETVVQVEKSGEEAVPTLTTKLGIRMPIEFSASPIIDDNGYHLGITYMIRDITRRMESGKIQAKLFESASEGFMITDAKHIILQVNPAFVTITGYAENEVIGKSPGILSSGWHKPDFYAGMWRSIQNTGHWSGEIWNKHKNGEYFLEEITISEVSDETSDYAYYVAVFKDITEKKQLEAKLFHQASHDILTDLPNRLTLSERYEQAIQYVQNHNLIVCVLYLNIDNLKLINETYGHCVGDQLLKLIAERLDINARASSTVARIGGDEFVILLPDLRRQEDYVRVAEKTREVMSMPFDIVSPPIYVTFSIGICFYPDHGDTLAALIKNANHATNQAKGIGPNQYQLFSH